MWGAKGKRVETLLSAVGVLAAVAALAMLPGRLRSDSSRAPSVAGQGAGQGSVRRYACAAPVEIADEYCRRAALNWSRRAELTTLDRGLAGGSAAAVDAAASRADRVGPTSLTCAPERPPTPPPCQLVRGADPRTTAEELRKTLLAAGFSNFVVRAAEADDPAPDGSVVYAVRVDLSASDSDAASLIGYVGAGDRSGPDLVGTLPGGDCLSD